MKLSTEKVCIIYIPQLHQCIPAPQIPGSERRKGYPGQIKRLHWTDQKVTLDRSKGYMGLIKRLHWTRSIK